jgi:hypothetical protein
VHTRAPPSAIGAAHDWGAALAWAGRGDWDSAFVALQRYTRSTTHPRGPVWSFGLAAVGAWVGALDPALPLELRPAALRSPFSRSDDGRAELAWLDGLLACAQGNVAGLDSARASLLASGVPATPVLARSLHGLADTESTPATLLDAQTAVADEAWAFRYGADHPFVIAVDRISTARGLLASGDTATATRLLRLNETELPGTLQPLPAIHQVLATLTLDVLARSAEARGEARPTQYYRALFAERTEGVLAPHRAIPASCTSR